MPHTANGLLDTVMMILIEWGRIIGASPYERTNGTIEMKWNGKNGPGWGGMRWNGITWNLMD